MVRASWLRASASCAAKPHVQQNFCHVVKDIRDAIQRYIRQVIGLDDIIQDQIRPIANLDDQIVQMGTGGLSIPAVQRTQRPFHRGGEVETDDCTRLTLVKRRARRRR